MSSCIKKMDAQSCRLTFQHFLSHQPVLLQQILLSIRQSPHFTQYPWLAARDRDLLLWSMICMARTLERRKNSKVFLIPPIRLFHRIFTSFFCYCIFHFCSLSSTWPSFNFFNVFSDLLSTSRVSILLLHIPSINPSSKFLLSYCDDMHILIVLKTLCERHILLAFVCVARLWQWKSYERSESPVLSVCGELTLARKKPLSLLKAKCSSLWLT